MVKYTEHGWRQFLRGYPWFSGKNPYPLQAYSEFMPPLRTGINPADGTVYPWVLRQDDPYGWQVPEMEEEYQLRPGLEKIGMHIHGHITQLGKGAVPVHLAGHKQRNLTNNIFWPPELAALQGNPGNERYVSIQPVSLSKTKDDKGRVTWTFFGASEQGPEKPFWKSFYESPREELPAARFMAFMQWIFKNAYGIRLKDPEHLRNLGFRILPSGGSFPFPYWEMKTLPSFAKEFITGDTEDPGDISYLLTFRPFGKLPAGIKEKYLAGKLALLPFPGSLVPWGSPEYIRLQEAHYDAIQVPMLRLVRRDEGHNGLRVAQSGWLHQPKVPGEKAEMLEEFIVNSYVRTNRWDKFHRNEDGLLQSTEVDPVFETLFSTNLKILDLYNKPMARNSQLFSEKIEMLLDGPRAGRKQIAGAALKLLEGGLFRYRFYFPPMQAGLYEVSWHRPIVSCLSGVNNVTVTSADLVTGFMTAYHADKPDPADAVELWPRIPRGETQLSVLHNFDPLHDHYLHQASLNLMVLLETWELSGKRPLERDFARSLVRIPKDETLEEWMNGFPGRSVDLERAKKIMLSVENILVPRTVQAPIPGFFTFSETATREYEEAFWNQICFLAQGEYVNKDNADVVRDPPTEEHARHRQRDLHKLGDYLVHRYQEMIASCGMEGAAEAGDLPFRWETDFEFHSFGGWQANQEGSEYERDILVVIPGKNRDEAVVMADHYDTAYMADVFDTNGARLSAAGADDNHSATSTLLLAAPVFLKMAREGRLERDIWLLHLTGEEFPSDCMGARYFCRQVVQRSLKLRRNDGSYRDLSKVSIKGVLVMDMIAHNRENGRDVFQVAPGQTGESLNLAYQAHLACRSWNANVDKWNESPGRKGCTRGRRTTDGLTIPETAQHLKLDGEVRTWKDPLSTLYNTDGIIFSDTGIPVILFMENYDINRTGYHDTHDTMENIDLDYGAAVSAIAIETIARIAVNNEQ